MGSGTIAIIPTPDAAPAAPCSELYIAKLLSLKLVEAISVQVDPPSVVR